MALESFDQTKMRSHFRARVFSSMSILPQVFCGAHGGIAFTSAITRESGGLLASDLHMRLLWPKYVPG